jgi:perosamine synthetase
VDLLERKRALAERYRAAFATVKGASFFSVEAHARSNHWLNTCLIAHEEARERDEIIGTLNHHRIQARPCWTLMHKLPMYRDCPRMDLASAESLERRIVNLPSSAHLMPASTVRPARGMV